MDYKKKVAELIKLHLNLELNVDDIKNLIEIPPKSEMGDYAFPCFKLSKIIKKAPNIIAEELMKALSISKGCEKIQRVGSYLNFFIDKGVVAESVINSILKKGHGYGTVNKGKGKTVCIECSLSNMVKSFNSRHLITTVIGNALYKIFESQGYNAVRLNYSGDWNTGFGMLIPAYDKWIAEEAFYNGKIDAVVDKLREKGLLVESNGCKVIMLKEYNMPPCILLKGDEVSTYEAIDLAAAMHRRKNYNFSKSIYISGTPQALHFKQVFKVLELAGNKWVNDCTYVGVGLVKFSDRKLFGKNSSSVFLEDLLYKAVEKTMEEIKDNEEINNKEEAAKKIGIGAVIFACLKRSREKNIIFDWKETLSFKGETGPYVQYTYVRGNNILIRAGENHADADYSKLYAKEELELIKNLADFNNMITLALDKLEPSILARYIIEIAKGLNEFYDYNLVLGLEDETLKKARLNLVKAGLQVIKNGLELLGIDVI